MSTLLERLTRTGKDENPAENLTENTAEIPDQIPSDWTEGFTPDPVPAPRRGSDPLAPKTYGRVTATMQKKIAEQISMYIDLLAMPLAVRDPLCGGALSDQAEALGKAFAKILAKYPEAAHKMLAGGVLGDWLAVLMAAQPIATAVWSHHIAKTTGQEGIDDGADLAELNEYIRPGR